MSGVGDLPDGFPAPAGEFGEVNDLPLAALDGFTDGAIEGRPRFLGALLGTAVSPQEGDDVLLSHTPMFPHEKHGT
jgi:hypothetical protein